MTHFTIIENYLLGDESVKETLYYLNVEIREI